MSGQSISTSMITSQLCRRAKTIAIPILLGLAACSTGTPDHTGDPQEPTAVPSSATGTASADISNATTCGSTCTDCVLTNRKDILPFYQMNGWDISCGNHDSIANDWCRIDHAGCFSIETGTCGPACASCGTPCTACILSHRTDILPFYNSNGWDTGCANRNNVTADWCRIDPAGCNSIRTGVCASSCGGSTLPCGKLGGQALQSTAGFQSLLALCPRVVKWIAVGGVDFASIQAFKARCPASKTVLRMYGPQGNYATASDMWNARYGALNSATAAQKAAVDYLESDNETDAGHGFTNPQDYNTFLTQFVNLAASKGFRPLVGNIAVGNPGGNVDSCTGDGMLAFGAIVPAIQAASQAGGGWAYHSYTPDWSKDVNAQGYYALRYRKYVTCFPQLRNITLVLTEGGFDNQRTGGYLANGGAAPFVDWLTWYQRQLAVDPYVIGTTLFTYASGNTWPDFQLDPVEPQLENIIRNCP